MSAPAGPPWAGLAAMAAAYCDLALGLAGIAPPRPPGTLRGVDIVPAAQLPSCMARLLWQFHDGHGAWPRLQSPRTFGEKLFVAKLLSPHRRPTIADKLVLHATARRLFGPDSVPELLWQSRDAAEVEAAVLGLPAGVYFLKANHGSGMNLRLDLRQGDRAALAAEATARARAWLAEDFAQRLGEFQYALIARRVLIERALAEDDPLDWRFLVFHGRVRLIWVTSGSYSKAQERRQCFWPDGTPADFVSGYPGFGPDFRLPPALPEMTAMAERLGVESGQGFARVDLYWSPAFGVKVGEVTLTPNGGRRGYRQHHWRDLLGSWWDLEPVLGFR